MTGGASLPPSLALAAIALTTVASGCTLLDPTAATQRNLGQPNGDFPSYDERVTLYATNRARVDPAAEGWPAYVAQPPLQWSFDLNRSARAHSIDMRDTPCFQHNSCDGTETFARIDGYFTGTWMTMGENISAGRSTSDGFIAVHNWIYEIGAPAGEIGHRENIFAAKFTLMGAGFAPGGTRLQNYWTQDFVGAPVSRPRLADGIHFPRTVAAGAEMAFGITFFDAGNAPPVGLAAVVDGACAPLTLARGAQAWGAYEVKVALADGCHPYYFLVAAANGALVTYPDSGALQAPAGGAAAACPLFTTTRVDVRCDGPATGSGGNAGIDGAVTPPDGTGGTATPGDDAGGGTAGEGGTTATGTGGAAGSGTDGGPDLAGPAVGGCASGSGGSGGSGCRVGAGVAHPAGLLSMALAAFALARRRRIR